MIVYDEFTVMWTGKERGATCRKDVDCGEEITIEVGKHFMVVFNKYSWWKLVFTLFVLPTDDVWLRSVLLVTLGQLMGVF